MRPISERIAIVVGAAGLAAACSRSAKEAPAAEPPSASSPSAASAAPTAPTAAVGSSFPVPLASVEQVVNPQALPVYQGPTGSVEGTVYVLGPRAPNVTVDVKKCPAALDVYGKLFREGPARADGSRPLADVAVVAVGYTGSYVPERSEAKQVSIGPPCTYP